ncbi:hypothetical protein LCGC14_2960400, partial [marine sediment metagenome]
EVARILQNTAQRLARGEQNGTLRDFNGNNVGGFYLAEDETDDEKKSEE